MSAHKSSAVDDQEPLDVLVAVHEKFDLLDFAGAVEVFNTAVHDLNDPESKSAFPCINPSL
jgi:hypothetical protein